MRLLNCPCSRYFFGDWAPHILHLKLSRGIVHFFNFFNSTAVILKYLKPSTTTVLFLGCTEATLRSLRIFLTWAAVIYFTYFFLSSFFMQARYPGLPLHFLAAALNLLCCAVDIAHPLGFTPSINICQHIRQVGLPLNSLVPLLPQYEHFSECLLLPCLFM